MATDTILSADEQFVQMRLLGNEFCTCLWRGKKSMVSDEEKKKIGALHLEISHSKAPVRAVDQEPTRKKVVE